MRGYVGLSADPCMNNFGMLHGSRRLWVISLARSYSRMCVGIPYMMDRRGRQQGGGVLVAPVPSLLYPFWSHLFHSSRTMTAHSKKNYYDTMKLSPKATQAQVKEAYYKLSKTYHPDQYQGTEDANKKFREITEAYEVLGNFQKRRLYDKGLLGTSTAATPSEAESYTKKFYESRSRRHNAPVASGRTPIFDFDEWSKLHYEDSRERRVDARERYEKLQRNRRMHEELQKTDSIISVLVLLMVIFCVYSMKKALTEVDEVPSTASHSKKT